MLNKDSNKNEGIGCSIILLIIVAVIFIPIIFNTLNEYKEINREQKLIEEGKIIYPDTIVNEFIEILKNRDEQKLKEHISNDFIYYDDNNNESKFISEFWKDLKYFTGKYYLEKRENSIQGEETYWIYWDIPEQITKEQYSQYSLQRIYVYMKKITKEDIITYQINKIILKDN